MAKVTMSFPDRMSQAEIKESLSRGVSPEVAILLRDINGILGALEQAVTVLSQSQRMSAESMARAYRDAQVSLDTGTIEAEIRGMRQDSAAHTQELTNAVQGLGGTIAEAVVVLNRPRAETDVGAILDGLAPMLSQRGPKVRQLDVRRGDDDFIQSVGLVYDQ